MNIHAYILCYNEAAMVRHTLAHYSAFCSKIIVYDNESTDGTLDIIAKHFPEVEVISYESGNQIDDAMYLEIKNTSWQPLNQLTDKVEMPDYVVVCDMDELLWAPNIKQVLADMHAKGTALPRVTGYNMIADSFPDDYDTPITSQAQYGMRALSFDMLKQGAEMPSFDKQIIFDPNQVKEINFTPGAHACHPQLYKGEYHPPQPPYPELLKLLHYKYMGKEHLHARHTMYVARLSDYNKQNGFGAEYEQGIELINERFKLINNRKVRVC